MTKKLTEVNPTHEVGATRSVETQGATNSSQAYESVVMNNARKGINNSKVVVVDISTMILEIIGLVICIKGFLKLFNSKKHEKQ